MIATLEFSLPAERMEHALAVRAYDLAKVVLDLEAHVRGRLKYGDLGDQAAQELERVRDLLPTWVDEISELDGD